MVGAPKTHCNEPRGLLVTSATLPSISNLQPVGGGELAGAHGEASLLDADVHVDVAQLAALGDELTGAQAQMQVGRGGVEPGELPFRRRRGRGSAAREHTLERADTGRPQLRCVDLAAF